MPRRRRQPPIEAKVRCQGKLHRIVLTRRGHIALRDHPDFLREEVLENLSGEQCRCREILGVWQDVIAGRIKEHLNPDSRVLRELPRPLRIPAYDAAMKRRQRQISKFDPNASSLVVRFAWRDHGRHRKIDQWLPRVAIICRDADHMLNLKLRVQYWKDGAIQFIRPHLTPDFQRGSSRPILCIDMTRDDSSRIVHSFTVAPIRFALGYKLTGGIIRDTKTHDDMLCLGVAPDYSKYTYRPSHIFKAVAARFTRSGFMPCTCMARKGRDCWEVAEWIKPIHGSLLW
jgi:hypothetical protein